MSEKMIEYKENFISKIKKFWKTLFGKQYKETKKNKEEKSINVKLKNDFLQNIEFTQNEEAEIIKLQRMYKSGNISEEDMTYDEHNKLIELYKKQNNELEEKIEAKKAKIRKRFSDLKAI